MSAPTSEDEGIDFWCTACEEEYAAACSMIAGRQLCEDCERAWQKQANL